MTNAIHGGQLMRVDGLPLEAPEVTSPAAFVSTQKPAIGGTAKPGSTVMVRLDGASAGTITADAQGAWTLTPGTALAEGRHRVVAIVMNAVGNVSPESRERNFTIDTVPPGAPVVIAPDPLVNNPKPVIAGTAEPGTTVIVRLGNDGTNGGTVQADAAGNWSFPLATVLPEGLYHAQATATDTAGNLSPPSGVHLFTVDTVPPGAPVVTAPGTFSRTLTPVIRGTAEPNSTVKVWLGDDEALAETVIVNSAGDWRFTPRTALEFGYHFVSAIATDAAGNPSALSKHRFALQRSHYGGGCTTTTALPTTWALLMLALSLGRSSRSR